MTETLTRVPPNEIRDAVEEMRGLTKEQMREVFDGAMRLTVDQIRRMAAVVFHWEEQGHELSELNHALLYYLRRVASGQMLPDLLPSGLQCPEMLERISSLPLPDQKRLVRDPMVPVVELRPGGVIEVPYDATKLTRKQANQVFEKGHIRSVEEQVAYLRRSARDREPLVPSRDAVLPRAVTVERNGIRISGATFITKRELAVIMTRFVR